LSRDKTGKIGVVVVVLGVWSFEGLTIIFVSGGSYPALPGATTLSTFGTPPSGVRPVNATPHSEIYCRYICSLSFASSRPYNIRVLVQSLPITRIVQLLNPPAGPLNRDLSTSSYYATRHHTELLIISFNQSSSNST
jgi:hypothetical protein